MVLVVGRGLYSLELGDILSWNNFSILEISEEPVGVLKTKGEILTNYDKRKYQLLIEKDRVHLMNFITD